MGTSSTDLSDHLTDEAESLAGDQRLLTAAAAAGQLAVHRPQRVRELRHLAQVRELGVLQNEFCTKMLIFFNGKPVFSILSCPNSPSRVNN